MLRLSTYQSMKMQVTQQSVPLRQYLKQPRRLIHALMNPSQIEELEPGHFRLHLRVIQFLMITIRPVVDLHIDVSRDRALTVRSTDCTIHANDTVEDGFDLALTGLLRLEERDQMAHVVGHADLAIAFELPPILKFTPHAILETTGNQILKGILLTMKQRLMRQLVADYEQWSAQQLSEMPQLALVNGVTAACSES